MALRSKLLDEKVVESAKEMLKEVRNNGYVSKKLNAVIAAKKHSITAVAKIYCISRSALTSWVKLLKFGREEKLFAPPQRRRKTKLNQAQLQQIEAWIEENPNIIAFLIIFRTDHNNTMLASWLTTAIKMFSPPVRTIVRRAITDRSSAVRMVENAKENLSEVKNILVDAGYTGENFATQIKTTIGATVEVIKRSELHSFVVLPKRWVVERSFA